MAKRLLIFLLCIFLFAGCNTTIDEASSTSVETSSEETSSTPEEITTEKNATITIDYADNTLYNEVSFAENNANYNLIFSTDATVKDFTLLEMDESEVLQVGDALWCIDDLTPEKPIVVSTYLNDATISRGISYTDQNGEKHIFSIFISMKDSSLSLVEFKEQKTLTIDEAFDAYLKGEIPAVYIDGRDKYIYEQGTINFYRGIGSYELRDVTGDGVPEMLLGAVGREILMYQDGKLVTIYVAHTNGMNGPIALLENGAMFEKHVTTGNFYYYTTFNADGSANETQFGLLENPEDETQNDYWFGEFEKKVTKQEFDELTKDIFAAAEKEAKLDWIERTDYTDSFFNAYLKGKIPAIDDSKETYVYQHTRTGDGKEGIDDYAFYDVTGDGVPELHLKSMGYEILMCQNRELVTIYESGTNFQHGPIVLLENGAMLEEHTTFETTYTYTTFDSDGTSNKTEFGLLENPEDETQNEYWFGEYDKKVIKEEFDKLTKDIFAAAEKKAEPDWIEWTQQ